MLLSNVQILEALGQGRIVIEPHPGYDTSKAPFSTMALDLHLDQKITIPSELPAAIDLTREEGDIKNLISKNSHQIVLTKDQPFQLKRNRFVLAQTEEYIDLPILSSPSVEQPCISARVEGKSSIARCGLLVHFTAPTIHNGFHGNITLEIINHGPNDFLLTLGMPICQLIFEEVAGAVTATRKNKFHGQRTPEGLGDAPNEARISAQEAQFFATERTNERRKTSRKR